MELVPGLIAGFFSIISIYPTEYIRIVAQNDIGSSYKNIVSNTYKNYGVKGFYKGVTASALRNSVDVSIKFGVYNRSKQYTDNKLISGICTGFVTACITMPLINLTNRNVIVQNLTEKSNMLNDIKFLGKNPSFIYRGLQMTVYKNILSSVGLFTSYDIINTYLNNYNLNKHGQILLSGSIAGMINCSLNNPLDVIITQKQTNYTQNLSYINIINNIYKQYGLIGFYKGFVVRSTRPIIGRSVMFYTYEYSKRIMENY